VVKPMTPSRLDRLVLTGAISPAEAADLLQLHEDAAQRLWWVRFGGIAWIATAAILALDGAVQLVTLWGGR
jgi:hypothetical protein